MHKYWDGPTVVGRYTNAPLHPHLHPHPDTHPHTTPTPLPSQPTNDQLAFPFTVVSVSIRLCMRPCFLASHLFRNGQLDGRAGRAGTYYVHLVQRGGPESLLRAPTTDPEPPVRLVMETRPGTCDLFADHDFCRSFASDRTSDPEPYVREALISFLGG